MVSVACKTKMLSSIVVTVTSLFLVAQLFSACGHGGDDEDTTLELHLLPACIGDLAVLNSGGSQSGATNYCTLNPFM